MDAKKLIESGTKVIGGLTAGYMLAAEIAAEQMGEAFDAAAFLQRAAMHNTVLQMLTDELRSHMATRDDESNPILKTVALHNIVQVGKRIAELMVKTGIDQRIADQAVLQMTGAASPKQIARDPKGRFAPSDEADLATTNGQHN